MDSEIVEQSTEKELETGEQSLDNVKETENMNPGETVGEEAPVKELEDAACPMVTEEDTSLGCSKVTPTIEKETNDVDPPKIDDEKNSQLNTSSHLSLSPSVPLDPNEGLIKPTVDDTVELNTGSSEVSSNILKNDGDYVMVEKEEGDPVMVEKEEGDPVMVEKDEGDSVIIKKDDIKLSEDKGSLHHNANAVMEQDKDAEENDMISSEDHTKFPVNPDTKPSEEKESQHHHSNTVMEQEKTAEEHDIIASGDHNECAVNPDAKLSEENKSPHHHANTEMEQDKAGEQEYETLSSRDHNKSPANPDTKVVEENNDRIDVGEENNMNLANDGSGPVDYDQGTTMELEEGLEVPGSETVSLEDKPSKPLIDSSMDIEKEPEMPATENLTDNDIISDALTSGVPEYNDKGPATQTSSDHNVGMTTLEAESTEDTKLDVPDSKLVIDASVDSINDKDVNVEAVTNTEQKDNSRVPERDDADNESALARREPDPSCVASPSIKSEAGISGDLNNGVHKIELAPPSIDRTRSAKRSFLLDDMSDGNESGTEEDQSAFMKELYSFFKERNMDFKPPKFYGEGLNCLKLFRAVTRLGGYDKVTGSKLWRQVGESFRPPKTCTTVSWTFRGFYEKALVEYERHKVIEGELHIPLASEPEPMNIDNQASGSGRARRDSAARAMQGWHSQRLNGNGEVNDPAMKDKSLLLHQKREKQIGTTPGLLKRKRQSSTEHGVKNTSQVSKPMLDVTVVDVGPPADWVKINVQRTQDCFEVYALVPGLVREEVRVQSDPAGRLVISGEPENPMNPWGATPFKKVVSLPTRIDPHHTSAVVTLNGQLFVRVPLEPSD